MKTFVLLIILLTYNVPVRADDGSSVYVQHVKPLLRDRCTSCHGALKQEAGLRLDTAVHARTGGENGAAVISGDPAASLLLQRISTSDADQRMPPEGKPLTADEIQTIRHWIQSGAVSPPDEQPDEDPRTHWAFLKPVRPMVPVIVDRTNAVTDAVASIGLNPVDAFIADQRNRAGIVPVPPTDRATLLRRLTLDLTGLPPTADELQMFVHDESPEAFRGTVDRLLDSPRYGERWARHWMDVWRYSDWYGRRSVPDVMNSYPMIWRWRDWIVQSINTDKGYDQMIVEMLAADELFPDDDRNLAATGYLVRSWFKWNYETWKKELVEHTGKAFLGLTLNCAQCHDHKYDPIAQEEYFRFRAFFEPLELRHNRMPGETDPGPFQKYIYGRPYGPISSGMVRVFDEQLNAETWMFAKGDARLRIEGKPAVTPAAPTVLRGDQVQIAPIELPITAAYPGMKEFVRADERAGLEATIARLHLELAAAQGVRELQITGAPGSADGGQLPVQAAEARLHAAEQALSSLQRRIEADDARYSSGRLSEDRKDDPAVQILIHAAWRSEREAAVAEATAGLIAADAEIAAAELKLQAATQPADAAASTAAKQALSAAQKSRQKAAATLEAARTKLMEVPGEYTPLSPKYPQQTTGRRTALARWIASRENPLTARVAVNHIWLRHFGQGLVESPHDFGRNGSRPTHPELLDWLACELMDSGWSMKHLHRLIVSSRTYQLTSVQPQFAGKDLVNPGGSSTAENVSAAMEKDPDNRTYWRYPAQRMEAEVVRDSLLAVAGVLDETMGGHEIDHRQGMTSHRRSLYFAHHGEERMEFLELFDAASAIECYRRTSSVQPQQALALVNSELTGELSRILAGNLWEKAVAEPIDSLTQSPVSGTPVSETTAAERRFVRTAFLQILSREPYQSEEELSLRFLSEQTQRLAAVPETQDNRTPATSTGAAGSVVRADPSIRARENFVHALMNHNDFVTIR